MSSLDTQKIEYHLTSEGDLENNVSAKFVCVYMYIIMELDQQKMAFNNILKVIEAIKESTLNKRNIQSNVALSLLEKDLYHLALSLDQYGISYIPKSSTNRFASWFQLVHRGESILFKVLELNKDKLTSVIEINMKPKLQVREQHRVLIGCVDSPQKLSLIHI